MFNMYIQYIQKNAFTYVTKGLTVAPEEIQELLFYGKLFNLMFELMSKFFNCLIFVIKCGIIREGMI